MIETGLEPEFEVILIQSQEDAEKYKFSGSPMVTVNNIDVDSRSQTITAYSIHSCRVYVYEGQVFDHPPKSMLLAALNKK